MDSGEPSRVTSHGSDPPPPTSRSGPASKTGPTPVQKNTVLDLRSVVVVTQVSFSLALATLLALAPPVLLLLNTELSASAARYAFILTVLAGAVAALRSWLDMRRLDFLLRSLAEGSEIFDASDVTALSKQAGRSSVAWLWPHLLAYFVGVVLFLTPLQPALMDITTAVSLMLLCAAIAATSTLALYAT